MLADQEASRRLLISTALPSKKRTAVVSPDMGKTPQERLAYPSGLSMPLPQQSSAAVSSSSTTVRSQSIPIASSTANRMKRTPSELQLCQDEQLADYRDYVMFSRIFDGISARKQTSQGLQARYTNERCLEHIVNTRNDVTSSSSAASSPNLVPMGAPVPSALWWTNHSPISQEIGELDEEIFSMDM